MLTQEEIQKIQNLLQEIQNKKETLTNQSRNLEVELKINEQHLNQSKEYFKEKIGTDDLNEIESKILEIENEIKTWITESEKFLNNPEI